MADHSRLTDRLVRDGCAPRRAPGAIPAFSSYPAEIQAAVNAYDEARREAYGRTHEPAMSDANKAAIAPFIAAAVEAWAQHRARSAA